MDPILPTIILAVLLTGLIVLYERRDKAKRTVTAAANPNKSPEDIKADRLNREAREREAQRERLEQGRIQTSAWLQIIGVIGMLIAFWILVIDPGSASSTYSETVVNIQKLYIGQTSGIVGAIFLSTGLVIKFVKVA